MFSLKRHSLFLLLASCVFTQPLSANETAESFANHITNKYLNSNFETKIKPVQAQVTTPEPTSFMKELNKNLDSQRQILTEHEAQEAAFSLVAPAFATPTTIIDKFVIDKLELIGGGENKEQHLFGILFGDKLHTTLGKAHAAFTFCNPITDVKTLKNRQQAISLLSSQQSNLATLNKVFASIQKSETKTLTYWHSKPVLQERLMGMFYFNMGALKNLNANTGALEISNKTLSVGLTGFNILYLPSIVGYITHQTAKTNNCSYAKVITNFAAGIKNALSSPDTSLQNKIVGVAYGSLVPLVQVFNSYIGIRNLMYLTEGTTHLQDILMATTNHVKQLKNLSTFVNKNRELVEFLPSLQPLADFNNSKKRSTAMNKLIGMLETNTFKGKPSFWSITGRVLAAHKLMQQVKDEFSPVFAAAGELEMYSALAQLYAKQQGKNATWCMANFVENSTTPVLETENFWNPFINPDAVVVNDATFNREHANSILTGPNTGGKSTVIKGLMLGALTAQTFGIAPATSFIITPFAKLNCFMNIADDIATGASLFKSEVARAKELNNMITCLKKNEFSFVIIDEVFTGTSPVEGEMAALRFAKNLANFRNSTVIIATHYPKMTTLEDETQGKFYNHHVEVLRNEDGSLNRTFKLKNGPTFVNVAFDILEEEGLVI